MYDKEAELWSRIHVLRSGLRAVSLVAQGRALSETLRRRLLGELTVMDLDGIAAQVTVCFRVSMLGALETFREGYLPSDHPLDAPEPRSGLLRFVLDRDLSKLLRDLARFIEAGRRSTWEAYSQVAVRRSQLELSSRRFWFVEDWSLTNLQMLHQELGKAITALALRDAAILGLACGLHRSAYGEYPARLDDLAPQIIDEVPPDPFTGEPFVYRRTDRGFVVYSVGPNLEDDGGVEDRSAGKDDIAWEGAPAPEGDGGR
jgi:hypothetical protein